MLKLKLQSFGHLIQTALSLEKTMMLGKIEGKRRRRWQSIKWFDSITESMSMSVSNLWEIEEDRETWHPIVHGVARFGDDLVTEQQQHFLSIFLWYNFLRF